MGVPSAWVDSKVEESTAPRRALAATKSDATLSVANPTGTITRTTFDTATVTLPQLAERVNALIVDLKTAGVIR